MPTIDIYLRQQIDSYKRQEGRRNPRIARASDEEILALNPSLEMNASRDRGNLYRTSTPRQMATMDAPAYTSPTSQSAPTTETDSMPFGGGLNIQVGASGYGGGGVGADVVRPTSGSSEMGGGDTDVHTRNTGANRYHRWDASKEEWVDANGNVISDPDQSWGIGGGPQGFVPDPTPPSPDEGGRDSGARTGPMPTSLLTIPNIQGATYSRGSIGAERGTLVPIDASSDASLIRSGGSKRDKIVFDDLRTGIYTQAERQERPIGSMDDIQNLIPDKRKGALVQRSGYSLLTSSFNLSDGQTISSITTFKNLSYLQLGVAATTIFGIGYGSGNQVLFTYFGAKITQAGVITSDVKIRLGNSFTTTISGSPSSNTFVITSAANVPAQTGYIKDWVVVNTSRGNETLFITDYTPGTKTVTTLETVPNDWANTDNVTFYWHFHDNVTTTQTFPTTDAPIILTHGTSFTVGGGTSSTSPNPWWCGEINQVFFSGATKTLTFYGAYLCEAEIKSTNGFTLGNASGYTATGTGLDTTKRYFIGYVYETYDGQRSTLIKPATNYVTPTANQGIQATFTVGSNFNKRIRYINVFLAESTNTSATTMPWQDYFYITQFDLQATGWTYTESVATPGTWARTIQLDITNWNLKGQSLPIHLGTKEGNEYVSSMCKFTYGTFVNNRLLVGNIVQGTTSYPNRIRYSGFGGNGTPQYNVLPDVDGDGQITMPGGEAASINGLSRFEGNCVVMKETSSQYINITAEPSTWELQIIASNIGCDAPLSLSTSPIGVTWASSGRGLFLWRGGYPINLAKNILTTYQGIATTNKALWLSWYDPKFQTINFMLDDATTNGKKVYYSFHTDLPIDGSFSVTRHKLNNKIGNVIVPEAQIPSSTTGAGASVFFSESAVGAVYFFDYVYYSDNGTAIQTYFDTGDHTIDEDTLTHITDFYMSLRPDTTATIAGQLDIDVYVDGSILKTFSNVTKTKTYLKSLLPLVGSDGRRIRLVWNSNATPATWIPSANTDPFGVSIYEFGFTKEPKDMVGDLGTTSL